MGSFENEWIVELSISGAVPVPEFKGIFLTAIERVSIAFALMCKLLLYK